MAAAKPKNFVNGFPENISAVVVKFRHACNNGSVLDAMSTLRKCNEWRLNHGLRNTPSLSEALIKIFEPSVLFKQISNVQRLMILDKICLLSPDYPPYRWQMLKRHLLAKPFDIYHLFKRVRALIGTFKLSLGWTAIRGGQLIFITVVTFLMMAFSLALSFIIKYASHLIFYMRRFVRFPINTFLASLLIIIILLLPIFFKIGIAWLPLFCLVMMWIILTGKEKVITVLILLVFLGMSLGFRDGGKFFFAAANKYTYPLYLANYAQIEPTGIQRLEKLSKLPKKDSEILFTLGLLAKRRGDYKSAIRYYSKSIEVAPNFSECMNNLANVYLLMKESYPGAVQKARDWYKKAIKVNPTRAEFFYNLSKSFPLLQVEGMEYIIKARDLNPQLIDKLTKRNSQNPNQMLVDCLLPIGTLWRRAFSPGHLPETMNRLFWRLFWDTPFQNKYVMPSILIGLILVFSAIGSKFEKAVPCRRCGQLFFKTIPVHYSQGLCHQCQMIKQRSSQVDPELAKQKETEISSYRKKQKLKAILMGVLPGGGCFFFRGQAFWGIINSFFFFLFLNGYLVFSQAIPKTALWFFGISGPYYLCVVLAGIVYLIGFVPMALIFMRDEI